MVAHWYQSQHGSFGGPGLATDEYFSAGSDDFRGYVWKLPDTAELIERRTAVDADNWETRYSPNEVGKFFFFFFAPALTFSISELGFSEGNMDPRYVPVELPTPIFRLNGMLFSLCYWTTLLSYDIAGHKSIVNTTMIHPSFLHILTSGVERHIVLHSTAESSPCATNMFQTDLSVRNLPDGNTEDQERFLRVLHYGSHPTIDENGDESGDELDTIPLFDQWVSSKSYQAPSLNDTICQGFYGTKGNLTCSHCVDGRVEQIRMRTRRTRIRPRIWYLRVWQSKMWC